MRGSLFTRENRVPSGLIRFNGLLPRALPWAIESRPIEAERRRRRRHIAGTKATSIFIARASAVLDADRAGVPPGLPKGSSLGHPYPRFRPADGTHLAEKSERTEHRKAAGLVGSAEESCIYERLSSESYISEVITRTHSQRHESSTF